jgi:hypothetical protein
MDKQLPRARIAQDVRRCLDSRGLEEEEEMLDCKQFSEQHMEALCLPRTLTPVLSRFSRAVSGKPASRDTEDLFSSDYTTKLRSIANKNKPRSILCSHHG